MAATLRKLADMEPRRRNASKGINRLMLLFTFVWLAAMAVTLVWCFANALQNDDTPANAGAYLIGVLGSVLCLWLCETLAYGTAMIVLWVLRENVRD